MNEDIANWILEFLLRQRIDEKVVDGVLSSLPLKDNDNRLKKTLLLRRIESETSNGCVSEKLLDLLEIVEELDHREGRTASESMKQAYCAIAVDCTVRLLKENLENREYLDAVQRVWREKVRKVESLASEESNRWMPEIEAAVWNSDVCGKILRRNTRNQALKAIRVYLTEAWGSLGPTFLELLAVKFGNDVEGLCGGGGGGGGMEVPSDPCRKLVPFEEGSEKDEAPLRQKQVAMRSKRRRGAKISDADEGNEDESMNKSKCLCRKSGLNNSDVEAIEDESMKKDTLQAEVEPGHMEQKAAVSVGNVLPKALQISQTLSSATKTNSEPVVEKQRKPEMKPSATPEFERVQKALKSSSMELRASVRDPLSEALQTAQVLSSTMAINEVSRATMAVNQTELEARAPREATENDTEKRASDDPAQDNEGQNRNLPRRSSLMERNGTAHTLEWDDSIDNVSGGSLRRQPRLPSPKDFKSSPLNNDDDISKFKRPRRAKKMWTPLEEETLRTGVHKFGKGNWKLIWDCYPEVFQERTNEDLRYKWRLMERYL